MNSSSEFKEQLKTLSSRLNIENFEFDSAYALALIGLVQLLIDYDPKNISKSANALTQSREGSIRS